VKISNTNQNITISNNYQYVLSKSTNQENIFDTCIVYEKPENYVMTKEHLYKNHLFASLTEKSYKDALNEEQLKERTRKIQEFFKNDFEDFSKACLEHFKRVKEDPDYDPQEESKYFKDKRIYSSSETVFIDGECVVLKDMEWTMQRMLYDTSELSDKEWFYQQNIITKENKYEDAPEFEAFINNWIDKGATEEEAIERASYYAQLGLLNYGKQKVVTIDNLPYDDKQQHGMHLINNDTLKNAITKTLDSLNNEGMISLSYSLLYPDNTYYELKDGVDAFQNMINKFVKELKSIGGLSELNSEKYSSYEGKEFTGDINITEQMSQLQKNFIYDSLLECFKKCISDYEKKAEEIKEDLSHHIEPLKLLIKNFEEEVKKDNESNAILTEYTKNTKPKFLVK